MEITDQRLQDELDIDIHQLLTLSDKALEQYLLERKVQATHLDTLSHYLKETGESAKEENKQEAKNRLRKALELLYLADEISGATSFDRMYKKTDLETLLSDLK
ncbi:MAG: hypothetical protein WBH03_02055, partial [Cyclobacteriaceae bacterium]